MGKKIGDITYVISHCITVDEEGYVYVSGSFSNETLNLGGYIIRNDSVNYEHFFLAKFDSKGKVIWVKSSADKDQAAGKSIKIDPNGNVIVCGSFGSPTLTLGNISIKRYANTRQYFIAKYDSNGNIIWMKGASSTSRYSDSNMTGISIDQSGNIYTAGYFYGHINFREFVMENYEYNYPYYLFLVKYNASGNTIWAKEIKGSAYNSIDASHGVAISTDPSGNVVLGGMFSKNPLIIDGTILTNKGEEDIFIAKYNPSGSLIWAKSAGSQERDLTSDIIVDRSGNAYWGGNFKKNSITFGAITLNDKNSAYSGESFIAKYDGNGNALWAKASQDISVHNSLRHISCDANNNLYAIGQYYGSSLNFDNNTISNGYPNNIYIVKYNSQGQLLWTKGVGGSGFDQEESFTSDQFGNLYITGYHNKASIILDNITLPQSTTETNGVFLAKIGTEDSLIQLSKQYCAGDSIKQLTAPNGYQSYKWINDNGAEIGNSQTLNITKPKDSLSVSCKITTTQEKLITVIYTLLKNECPQADFTDSLLDCKTNTIQFTNLSTTNKGNLTYKWDFGDGTTSTETNPQHLYTTSGIHQVTLEVTNLPSTCTSAISKTIEYYPTPTVTIIGDSTICQNQPIKLKANGASKYLWSNGASTDSIEVSAPERIWVIGYSQSGCASDTIFRTIKDVTPTVTITGNPNYCPKYTTTLTAHGASGYLWSNGSSNSSIEIGKDTTVWLVGYSESGCVSDTVKFKVTQEPDWSFTLQGDSTYCTGESVTLTASGAVSYLWNTGSISDKIKVNTPMVYSVTGTNSRGCTKTLKINVIENALPDVDFTLSKSSIDFIQSQLECNVPSKTGVNYTWDLGDGTTETGPTVKHTYNVSNAINEYQITLTASSPEGCANSASKTIEVLMTVPNIFTPNGDGINDIFMPNVDLLVFDRNGVVLYNARNGWDGTYNGKLMPNDAYFYEIKYTDKNQQIQTLRGHVTLKK